MNVENKHNNEHLNIKRLEILFYQFRYSLIGNICTGLLCIFLFWNRVDHLFLAVWSGLSLAVLIIRTIICRTCQSGHIARSYRKYFIVFNAGAILTGSLWGVLALNLFSNQQFSTAAVMLVIVCGSVATTAFLYSVSYPTFISFAYPAALPPILKLLFQHDSEMIMLGVMGLLFLGLLTMMTVYMNKNIFRYFSYEINYWKLLDQMGHEKDEVVELNTDIMNELLRTRTRKEELQTENEKVEELANRLKTLSTTDSLTEIANRRCFDEFLEKEWSRSSRTHTPLSLVLCDIDCFKAFNDRYGHPSGDQCLKQVASLLADHARRTGDMAVRYGGEEFSIILSNTDIKVAADIAEQMRRGIEKLGILHNGSVVKDYVTASFGVASVIPDFETEKTSLIAKADHALYQAKQSGRNSVATATNGTVYY